jgi:hypothetical protein
MKMPALMMPKNAVTASNMVTIPDPAVGPNGTGRYTVKRIPLAAGFSQRMVIFGQQRAALEAGRRRRAGATIDSPP